MFKIFIILLKIFILYQYNVIQTMLNSKEKRMLINFMIHSYEFINIYKRGAVPLLSMSFIQAKNNSICAIYSIVNVFS